MPRTRGHDWRLTTEQVDLRAWLRQQWWPQWSECATLWLPTYRSDCCGWVQANIMPLSTSPIGHLDQHNIFPLRSTNQNKPRYELNDSGDIHWKGALLQFSDLSWCKRAERSLQYFPSLPITVVWSHEALCRQKHPVASLLPVASSHHLPSACLSVGVWRWRCCRI